jgi:ubiquinone/menaquinone biosynthesis C-methylase UbiE
MPDHEEIKSFYDSVYYKDASVEISPSKHLHRLAGRFVSPGQNVLDVACGTGDWLLAAMARGGHPNGIDLSAKAIDICQRNMPDGEFHAGAAETLPFDDDQFDLVTCLGSLEHFLDPVAAVTEMVRVSRDTAQFIILVPNSDFLTRRLGLYKGTYQTAAKEDVRTLNEWDDIFQAGGLQTKNRWKDLHMASWSWIALEGWKNVPLRALQVLALAVWPLRWQYQVYHLLTRK